MEKFDSAHHGHLLKELPFSYFTSAIYLDFYAYVFERNRESLVVQQDLLYPHDFPCLFLPKKKENWERCSVTFTTKQDRQRLLDEGIELRVQEKAGSEFYYQTKTLTDPSGQTKRDVELFVKRYTHRIVSECEPIIVRTFYEEWKSQKSSRDNLLFDISEAFFFFCLENLNRYAVRQVYIFADQKLVGLAWGVKHSEGKWVGLHLKSLYAFKGIGRFLHHQRALLFATEPEMTLGTEAHESGIAKFKEELGPSERAEYEYVLTGERKKNQI